MQRERQARHRAELEQYTDKKRTPLKRKNKIIASRKSSRLHPEFTNNKNKINKIKAKQAEPKTQVKPKRIKQKAHATPSSSAEQAKGLSTLGWIICGVLAGCLLGGFSYFYFLKPDAATSALNNTANKAQSVVAESNHQEVSVNLQSVPVKSEKSTQSQGDPNSDAKAQAQVAASSAEKTITTDSQDKEQAVKAKAVVPKFEFYTILPKQEVWSPPKQDVADPKAAASGNSQKNQYVLQIASFRNSKDATQLMQRLEKLKLHPYLSTVKLQSGQQWNRVMLGPFASKRDAEKVRRVLQDASIQPGLLKLKQNS
ncbi:hypothetical protein BGC07_07420 [Piscirickettsia litoralis]|uniref:SPOR domain-containing protein n=1 Tax=Piscirickettsia litoralis TaxID=1891921 RepID=A0ABX3A704_9GAMM|nr:hypothetical protein BGC07_07420 [Piscirickettsia litoralis]